MTEQSTTALITLDKATQMLAEAKDLHEVKQIMDMAEAARTYARAAKLGIEAANHAAEIKLRAERKAGEILAQLERAPRGRPEKIDQAGQISDYKAVLVEQNIPRTTADRWQELAEIPEETVELYIANKREAEDQLTTSGLLQAAKSNMAVHYSSESCEWYTPKEIIDRVVWLFGQIDLDPCSNGPVPNIPACYHYTAEDNGLAQDWFGKVYMNPPYGREIEPWVRKLCAEHATGRVTEAVALVPARTDTDWFRQFRDAAICFIDGRLKFSQMENSAPFPSAVIYLGPNIERFNGAFADMGDTWVRWEAGK